MARYRTVRTVAEMRSADREYERNAGRSPWCPPGHDAYLDSLAERMAAACERLGQTIDTRVA